MNQAIAATKFAFLSVPVASFPAAIGNALAKVKQRLQKDYEAAYPGLGEIFRLVLAEEERRAWELTAFPHLLFPDLVQAHLATLGLEPAANIHHIGHAPVPEHAALAAAG